MVFGSLERGKGTEVGEGDRLQGGLMGAFERFEPFDEQPLGDARGPGLPVETARRKRILAERDFSMRRACACRPGSSPRHGKLRRRRRGDRRACGLRKPRASTSGVGRCVDRALQAHFEARNRLPSCALSGVMQSQTSMNSGASCRSSRIASSVVSGPSAWRIASTVRLCWATDSGCSHREAPLYRMVRERPAARSSSVQACGSGLRRSSRRLDLRSTNARGLYHGPILDILRGREGRHSNRRLRLVVGAARTDAEFCASARWRSAKRSPGPLASVALQRTAPGSIAIWASSSSSSAIVPGPMPPAVAA